MALLPIISDEQASPEAKIIFDASQQMFGRVANAVRVSAHTPRVAQVLFGFIVAGLREEISGILAKQIKALVILKTSMLNGCQYCIDHNLVLGRACGLTDDQIAAIDGDYQASGLFTAAEKAALAWAQHMTELTYRENPDAMTELKKHFDDAQIVEISMTCGFFNFWNRFNDSLQIDPEGHEITAQFKKSATISVDDFAEYMKNCWWNEDTAAQSSAVAD